MSQPAATREAAVTAVAALGTYISVHTADPGPTGANEAAGGLPLYARKPTIWAAGAPDGAAAGSAVLVDLAPGTYTHLGCWHDATAGTFVSGGLITNAAGDPAPLVIAVQSRVSITPTLACP